MDPTSHPSVPPSLSPAPSPALEPELWTAGLRTDEAADGRRRRAALAEHGAADATLAGVLVDLAERGARALVTTIAGSHHRGTVVEVATTWVALHTARVELVLLRTAHIATIEGAGGPAAIVAASSIRTTGLAAMLDRCVELDMTIRCGAVVVVGELRSVGADVAAVRRGDGTLVQVSIDAIDEVVVPGASLRP